MKLLLILLGVLLLLVGCATITNNFDGCHLTNNVGLCPIYDELTQQWQMPKVTAEFVGDQFIDRPTTVREAGVSAQAGVSGSPVALQGPASGQYEGNVGNRVGRTSEDGPDDEAGSETAAVNRDVPAPGE